jgi:chromosome transmission fidelity protein 1
MQIFTDILLAGLILVDKRYGSARIRGKLPKWIGDSITAPENFGGAMKTLGAFYRGRKIQ